MPILTERAKATPVALRRFCLMTYDVRSCIGLDNRVSPFRVIAVVSRHRPDIVCLQELDSGCPRTGMVDQPALFADRLKMTGESFPLFTDEDGGESHLAVLSRFPLTAVRAGYLPPGSRRSNRKLPTVLWCETALPSAKLQVINVNLSRDAHEQESEAVRLLTEWIDAASAKGPVVLCGELNLPPGSAAYSRLASRLHDVGSSTRAANTWPNPSPFRRVDYVFATAGLAVENARVPQSRLERSASDHLPLVVQIKVP